MSSFRPVAAALALTLIPAAATAAPAVAVQGVNVRAAPSSQSFTVGALLQGEVVEASQCQPQWCYVQAPGVEGWVSAYYLRSPGRVRNTVPIEVAPVGLPPPTAALAPPIVQVAPPVKAAPPPKPKVAAPPPKPKGEACFFSAPDFAGEQMCLPTGSSVADIEPPFPVASMRLKGAAATFWAQKDFSGPSTGMTDPETNNTSYQMSSVKVVAN